MARFFFRDRAGVSGSSKCLFLAAAVHTCSMLPAFAAESEQMEVFSPHLEVRETGAANFNLTPLEPEPFWFATTGRKPEQAGGIVFEITRTFAVGLSPSEPAEIRKPRYAKGTLSASVRSAVKTASERTGRRLEFRSGDVYLNFSESFFLCLDEQELTYRFEF